MASSKYCLASKRRDHFAFKSEYMFAIVQKIRIQESL